MSKKPFEDIDNKIRQAAENSEHPFDEQAWNRMEALLDKEDKKRRPAFWWWLSLSLLLIIAAGTFLLKTKTGNVQPATITLQPAANDQQPTSIQQDNIKPINNTPVASSINTLKQQQVEVNNDNSVLSSQPVKNLRSKKHSIFTVYKTDTSAATVVTNGYTNTKRIKGNTKERSTITITTTTADEMNSTGNSSLNTAGTLIKADDTLDIIDKKITVTSISTTPLKDSLPAKDISTAKKDTAVKTLAAQHSSRFYFLAALGIDASSTKLFAFKNSTVTPRYGIGIGYQLNKKISIQTGFYAGHKEYIAGPDDYHPKMGSSLYAAAITKVSANCLIYEIPITIRYNIVQTSSFTYYVTAGLSSFIMKSEAYSYDYTINNNAYTSDEIYAGNKNLFSVLILSAGIEKKLSSEFSLQAEPSVNIPLAGVGAGSVKLYSAGIQLGLKYIPVKF